MSNFGKKYRKDPVKTFNRKQVSALHPRKPRKKSTNTTRAIKKTEASRNNCKSVSFLASDICIRVYL